MKKLSLGIVAAVIAAGAVLKFHESPPKPQAAKDPPTTRPPVENPKTAPNLDEASHQRALLLAQRERYLKSPGRQNLNRVLEIYRNDGFAKAWAETEKIEEKRHRGFLQKSLLGEMAKDGLVAEALELVNENKGLGADRERLVYQIVSRSDLSPSAALELYHKADNDIDQEGIGRGLSYLVMRHGINRSEFDLDATPDELKVRIANGLGIWARQRGSITEAIESIRILNGEGSSTSEIAREFVSGISGSSEKLKAFITHSSHNQSSDDLTNSIRSMARMKLALSSPEWLINQASSENNEDLMDSVPIATMMIVKGDPNEASRILDSIPSSQSQLRSAMMSGLSGSAVRRDEYDTAWEWHDQIESPEIRKKVGEGIRSSEKQFIEKAAQAEPEKTIESIISEDSIHKEYLIKEAFQQWTTMDPFRANSWYEKNHATLTAAQSQHFARSYVEQAIHSGELDEARIWLKKVGDAEYREPLQKEIEQASAEDQ